ncbi:MAG: SafA/ExsA family spore coat assembly protein [Firmicutes bacterium]|nr:SafA/ExsA family spore coat assembly protein [Bacillota bacterium]
MKKTLIVVLILLLLSTPVLAESFSYTVKPGDSLWKIAVKYEVGLSEIISENPQIKNPSLIYPGQIINVPNIKDIKALENEVIRLVNIERSKHGLEMLKGNWQLSRCARYKSKDMVNNNYFAHYSPVYGSPFKMMENFGLKFTAAGENIAKGQQSPKQVMNSWMNSPGHRNNILSPSFSEIGVGLAKDKYGTYHWTQMFMRATK